MQDPKDKIPEHKTGNEVNVEDSVDLPTEAEAGAFFSLVKSRLLAINNWDKIAGALSATFQLTNEQGQAIDTFPREGNYLKIDIPAPGIIAGEGFDWVRIEEVKEESDEHCEAVYIRVRPAKSPLNKMEDVAHFYTDDATSNFIIKREGKKVTAGVYGRNEKPNVKAETVIDKIRNAVVGSGAVTGFAKLQWTALVSGLLEKGE